ncbi:MAG: GTPase ObgE [Chitinophagales bacterium]|nr:GTPase ObgE [Chitinophagales bacterium]MDW8393303.1 GTPase ObgE [Chitinophagales bacterium]
MAAESNFVDQVRIYCRAGRGGNGVVHFRRLKYMPKGGPDGGDGGRGGHIILRGNSNLWTLLHLRYRKHIHAPDGRNGSRECRTGASGTDVVLDVPLGTVARDADTGQFLFEITDNEEQHILCRGGQGGLGNARFATPTNQAPTEATPGQPGEEGWKILELKLLADVGLVGFPNAGKSTLLAALTAAKPLIADYPFTTLVPQLGIVSYREHQSFVMADLPGILEGAHQGRGLGHRFLRHIERNAVLLFVISADAPSIAEQYRVLVEELKAYNPELLHKPRMLAISKADLIDKELERLLKKELPPRLPALFISAHTGYNLNKLKDRLWQMLHEHSDAP